MKCLNFKDITIRRGVTVPFLVLFMLPVAHSCKPRLAFRVGLGSNFNNNFGLISGRKRRLAKEFFWNTIICIFWLRCVDQIALQNCKPKVMFKGIIERMVLYQRNFLFFLGLFTISNHFRVRAGPDLVGPFTTLLML